MHPSSDRVVVVQGTRTPFVRARTVFSKVGPSVLGGATLRETVARTPIDPKIIGEICMGIVSGPAEGSNIAREAQFDSGLPSTIPATTINRYCASALEAAAVIAAKLESGQIEVGIAGGIESISSVRALFSQQATDFFQDLMRAKTPMDRLKMLSKFRPALLTPNAPGIKEPTTGLTMGQSADLMARQFHVSREEQDKFAVESHHKAHAAWERGFYSSHVIGVSTPGGKLIARDTDIRGDTSVQAMSKLRPVFYKDGTITAANASPLTDGASSCVLTLESKAKSLGLSPLGAIRSYAVAGVDIQKEPLLIGPAYAFPLALQRAGLKLSDIDLFEFHEAFAAQVLATIKALESPEFSRDKLGLSAPLGTIDRSKININGGSIPLGHPFGATGVRLILQTLHALREQKKRYGLISVCAAGGLGAVMIVEAI